jgi:hypothetical protein
LITGTQSGVAACQRCRECCFGVAAHRLEILAARARTHRLDEQLPSACLCAHRLRHWRIVGQRSLQGVGLLVAPELAQQRVAREEYTACLGPDFCRLLQQR